MGHCGCLCVHECKCVLVHIRAEHLPCSDVHSSPEIGISHLSLPALLTGLMIVAQSPAVRHLSTAAILGGEVGS